MILSLKKSLGIELRENELLMVAMKRGVKEWAVSGFKIIPNYKQIGKPELRREVQRFTRSSGAAREQIVLGIPREQTVLRLLELPREVEENLAQVIKFQVENLTPAEDVTPYYDFAILSRPAAHLQILLVMVKKEVLDEHLALINELGVQPNAVQLSTAGLSNLLLARSNMPPDSVHLLFNIGEKKLELVGIKNRQLWYSKHLNLTEEVPSGDLMIQEIDTALSTMRLEDGQIEKIWFSGKDAEAILPEFRARVEDSEYLMKPFRAQMPGGLQPLLANNLASTVGLALGGSFKNPPIPINLLPKERRVHYSKLSFAPTVILGLAGLLLALAPTAIRFRENQRFLNRIEAEVKRLKPAVDEVNRMKKENEALRKKVDTLEELIKRSDANLDLLKDLSQRIPENTYITTYRLQKGVLNLNLSSTTGATAVIKKLNESPYLKDPETVNEIMDPTSGRKTLQITAKVVKKEA